MQDAEDGAEGSKLTIKNVTPSDAGRYICSIALQVQFHAPSAQGVSSQKARSSVNRVLQNARVVPPIQTPPKPTPFRQVGIGGSPLNPHMSLSL